ncbi:MAG: hypothetical protein NWQ38_00100 [Cellulophaga sp.]|nr:hypothetical protein [Cellulophaga sp.]
MMKFKLIFISFMLFGIAMQGQVKYEREYRIKKTQFPNKAISLLNENLGKVKRLKFYKEVDSTKISFEAKFKKNNVWYSIEFSEKGILEDVEITIPSDVIPNKTFDTITQFLQTNFTSFKIKKIQQQYVNNGDDGKTLKDAFQNSDLSTLNYEIICSGKKDASYEDFEILFDASGKFKYIRKSLPPNYDHVLY